AVGAGAARAAGRRGRRRALRAGIAGAADPGGEPAEADPPDRRTRMTRARIPGLLERIAREDGAIRAFWQVDAAGALATPRLAAGALDGVAVGIKDNVDVAGLQATAGIAAFRGRVATADAPCV